ncbi:hypothetical protein PINS_up021611 [Pythium insidiosum]|nr:hypothetical protein PINS_up015337 [Pythium insidiosum]GLE09771.1 hypothetical protein PINS_up021611 [Pythium insidiosum]
MADSIFQKNPRNVRIAAWVLAAGAFYAWYQYDQKKEREFSSSEIQQWNADVLRRTGTKSEKERSE